MPFKKTHLQGALHSVPVRSLFIGRATELLFFAQQILKPEEPLYNILSIWGQGGVGKTTLLQQFKNQATMADCQVALVDEQQTTPAAIMEKCAQQLHLDSAFEKAFHRYKEALQFLPLSTSPRSLQHTIVSKAPDLAGSLVEGIPFAGPPLREITKTVTEHVMGHAHTQQERSVVPFTSPLDTLTQVFVTELNHLAERKGAQFPGRPKRQRKILLFFDTFEQVADEIVPWLLHSLLELEIHPAIVLVIAGRDPLERSTAAGPKPWLPYYETQTIYAFPLHPFTQEETTAYLMERGITAQERIETIWHLSHGLPLYLGLLTATTQGTIDATKDVVNNFLCRIPDSDQVKRRLALDGALFSMPFHLDDLEALPYLSEADRPSLYEWLIRQPFVRASSLHGRYIYHDLTQELFQRHLFQYSPKAYFATRKVLVQYYQGVLEQLQATQKKFVYLPSAERLEVILALVSQGLFLPDEESHIKALSPLLDLSIQENRNTEQVIEVLSMLRKIAQMLSKTQERSHAHQIVQAFLRFLEWYPQEIDTDDQKGKDEWIRAEGTLLKLIEHTSSAIPELLAKIHTRCGQGYMFLREYQQAFTHFERALQIHPHSALAYEGLCDVHYLLKEYQQSIADANLGLQWHPFFAPLYYGRGKAYSRLKEYQQALSDLEYALQLDRSYILAYGHRGRIYLELKEYEKALTEWNHIEEIVPEHPYVGFSFFFQGCTHLWLKALPQAITCFTRSYERIPTQEHFLWAREWSIMCHRYPDLETQQVLEAIAQGDHYTAHVCRGVICFLQKQFKQALIVFQHTLPFYEGDWTKSLWTDYWRSWDVHFWKGMAYLALDQEEEARIAIKQALILQMPPILLKPLTWFEQEKPKLYDKLIKPLLGTYNM